MSALGPNSVIRQCRLQCPVCPKAATERAAVDGSNVPYRSLPPFAERNVMDSHFVSAIMRHYSTDTKQWPKTTPPSTQRAHLSHGTVRGNCVRPTLEKKFLVASGDIGHLELDWLAATGGKPCFVIGHCEDLTVPTD